MIKILNEVGIKGTYLNILMAKKKKKRKKENKYYTQQLKAERLASKIKSKTRMPTLANFIQQSIGSSGHNNQTRKRRMGWEGRWDGGSGWGTHVHPWWVHVNVWQNHYNIIISLQLKNIYVYICMYIYISSTIPKIWF